MKHPDFIKMEDAPCPLGCTRDDQLVLTGRDRLHDLPGEFSIVRCNGCGLMRTNPRPTADTIGFYYPQEYAPYHQEAPVPKRAKAPTLWRRFRQTWRHSLGLIDPKSLPINPPGRLLEIGCANGNDLLQAQHQGWHVQGLEFSDTAAKKARERGLNVATSTVETFTPPAEPLDVIAGWMVFEHVHDPVVTFKQIREWVKPNGWLVLSVPDSGALEFRLFKSYWYALHLPGHMSHFSPSTMTRTLATSGWIVRKIIWHQNPNNLLHSLRYWALERGHQKLANYLAAMIAGKRGKTLHRALGKWLCIFRQSGRMTVWAQRESIQ